MAWIKVIEVSEAVGYLKKLCQKYLEPAGVVDNIMMIHSLNPKSLKTHYELYAHMMRGMADGLGVELEEYALSDAESR